MRKWQTENIKTSSTEHGKFKKRNSKQQLAPVNKQLKIHGGNDNKIKITKLKENQLEFLHDLITLHLEEYKNLARKEMEIFHYEDLKDYVNYKMVVHAHEIKIPEEYTENCKWELIIGRTLFGSTQVNFEMQGWKVVNKTLVG